MKFNLEKLYTSKIISVFYILLPIVEVITTFMIMNTNLKVTLGMVYKSIFTIYSIVYLLFIDKKNRKFNYLMLGALLIYVVISFFVTIGNGAVSNVFSKITILSRFICFPVTMLFLYKFINNGNKINLKTIVYSAGLYGFLMLVAGLLGNVISSYSEGLEYGNSGWFYSGNEISNLLSMFYPIIIYYIAKERTSLSVIALSFVTYGLMVIGTKTSLFALVIVTVTMFIFSAIIYICKRSNLSRNICIVCVVLGIFYIFTIPKTPAYKFMMKRYDASITALDDKTNKVAATNMDKFIYNGREVDLERQTEVYSSSGILEKLFGVNDNTKTLTKTGAFNVIERDFYDVLFIHGIIGIVIFFVPLVFSFIAFAKHVILNFKEEVNNYKFAIGSSIAIAVGISYIAGHVFLASTVAIFLALLCVEFSRKNKREYLKRKAVIYMPKLSAGGMEISLINFLNQSKYMKKFETTLCLGYVEDMKYLSKLPKNVEVRLMTKRKFDTLGKIECGFKYIIELIRCFDTNYDISICYSYHHKVLAILSRLASKNTVLFMHTDLINSRTIDEINRLNEKVEFEKFKVIACVSKAAERSILKLYPNYTGRVIVVNNYIDGEKILKLAKEKVDDGLIDEKNVPIFINVSRHFERAKKISRIIETAEKLKKEGYKFKVWLVGEGENTKDYMEMVKEKGLEDYVIFMGKQLNPYKYIAKSSALVISSDFEGYGMVIDEARVLNIPVLSTDVADAKEILSSGYGMVSANSKTGVYEIMKEFLDKGFKKEKEFNYKGFNEYIDNSLKRLDEYFKLNTKVKKGE